MTDIKWVRADMNLNFIDENKENNIIEVKNSGKLEKDFYQYAEKFYNAAECIIYYLLEEASKKQDIAKLDIWYLPMIFLYRQSIELLLKAIILKIITDNKEGKECVKGISHNLKKAFEKIIEKKEIILNSNENGKWLMKYLSDITNIDIESDMFRYPFSNGLKVLFERQTHISLEATKINMKKAYNIIKKIYNNGDLPKDEYSGDLPQLVVEGGEYFRQSVMGYKFAKYSYYPYYESYEQTAKFIKEIIIKQNKKDLFIPMCYLYRNAIELGLKRIIIEDSHIQKYEALKKIKKKKHSIQYLWNAIKEEVKEYGKKFEGDTTIDIVENYIKSFHELDSKSDLFRYPCNKNMESYFLETKKFDIENIASCFEELCTFLDSVDISLNLILEYEKEMESYFSY